jgi:molybdopterin converting factor small subunit
MKLTITTFGQLAELSSPTIILENITDITMLKNKIEELYPSLQNIKYAIAVNRKIIKNNIALNATSTVALLPPFSGG